MHITTLPISFRPGRPFRVLFTAFVASVVSRLCGYQQIHSLNLGGIRKQSELSTDLIVRGYRDELELLGIDTTSNHFFNDLDPVFLEFVNQSITARIETGECQKIKQNISFCSCGKVEIPTVLLNDAESHKIVKLASKDRSTWKCIFCGNELQNVGEVTIIHRLPICAMPLEITPKKLLKKAKVAMDQVLDRPVLISRVHRHDIHATKVDGYLIDTDYCWLHYLDFLYHQYEVKEIAIAIGINHIPQACKLVAFSNAVNPLLKVRLIVSPLIDFGNELVINKKTTLTKLIAELGSTTAARLFLGLNVRWNREVAQINLGDIWWIRESLKKIEYLDKITQVVQVSEEIMCGLVNRESIMRILKAIRKQVPLSPTDLAVLASLM